MSYKRDISFILSLKNGASEIQTGRLPAFHGIPLYKSVVDTHPLVLNFNTHLHVGFFRNSYANFFKYF